MTDLLERSAVSDNSSTISLRIRLEAKCKLELIS